MRLRYPELAPEGVAALSGVEHYLNAHSGLDAVLLEFVRLRVSLLNGCGYCIGLHSHELRKHNEPVTRIAAVETWQASDAFTQRERAALRWAEAITGIQRGHADDAEYETVRVHFDDTELVNLTLAISSINAFNRMAIAFRPAWKGDKAPFAGAEGHEPQANAEGRDPEAGAERDAVADDGGKVAGE